MKRDLFVALAVVLGLCACDASKPVGVRPGQMTSLRESTTPSNLATAAMSERSALAQKIRVGVNPFAADRTIRPDFHYLYNDPSSWAKLASKVGGYEIFVEALYHRFNDNINVPAFVKALNDHNLKIIVEGGGLRFLAGDQFPKAHPQCTNWQTQQSENCQCFTGMGKAYAQIEMNAYKNRSGQVDVPVKGLVMDNPYFFILGKSPYYANQLDRSNHCYFGKPTYAEGGKLSFDQRLDFLLSEIADYMLEYQKQFPGIEFGLTDGAAIFSTPSRQSGVVYTKTSLDLPDLDFGQYLAAAKRKFAAKGVSNFTHFDIDFADAVEADAAQYSSSKYIIEGRDFGRILGASDLIRKNGLQVGMFINYFYSTSNSDAKAKTIAYLRNFLAQGGDADHWSILFWQDFPNITGPENLEASALNTIDATVDVLLKAKGQLPPVTSKLGFSRVLASHSLSGDVVAEKAIDENLATMWNSGGYAAVGSPQWLQTDFTDPVALSQVQFVPSFGARDSQTGAWVSHGPVSYEIHATATDGSDVTLAKRTSDFADGTMITVPASEFLAGTAGLKFRSLKIVVSQSASWVALYEWSAFGSVYKPVPSRLPVVATTAVGSLNSQAGPELATDGNAQTLWNSGRSPSASAPVWIQMGFSGPATLTEVDLVPSFAAVDPMTGAWSATGPVSLEIYGVAADGREILLLRRGITVTSGQRVSLTDADFVANGVNSLSNLKSVKIVTTASASWVAWSEISAQGYF